VEPVKADEARAEDGDQEANELRVYYELRALGHTVSLGEVQNIIRIVGDKPE
jgi:hypothetical protein